MVPTKILVAVDGYRETSWAVRAAVEEASGTGSEIHVVHVVPAVPYLHLAAKEGVEDFFEWRRLKGLEVLDERVGRIGEDLDRHPKPSGTQHAGVGCAQGPQER